MLEGRTTTIALEIAGELFDNCDVYSTATPCPMCQGALYWGRIRRVYTENTIDKVFAPKLAC
jgi:tRNA(Arg) A34 adenosine deaminase TadA